MLNVKQGRVAISALSSMRLTASAHVKRRSTALEKQSIDRMKVILDYISALLKPDSYY